MKYISVLLLSILLLSLTFRDVVTYAHFYLNRSFIAETLCVNKDKPEMTCKGKCYLMKSLEENRDQEEKMPNPVKKERTNIVYFFSSLNFPGFRIIEDRMNALTWNYIRLYSFSFLDEVFHPPK